MIEFLETNFDPEKSEYSIGLKGCYMSARLWCDLQTMQTLHDHGLKFIAQYVSNELKGQFDYKQDVIYLTYRGYHLMVEYCIDGCLNIDRITFLNYVEHYQDRNEALKNISRSFIDLVKDTQDPNGSIISMIETVSIAVQCKHFEVVHFDGIEDGFDKMTKRVEIEMFWPTNYSFACNAKEAVEHLIDLMDDGYLEEYENN